MWINLFSHTLNPLNTHKNFHDLLYYSSTFLIKIQSNMSDKKINDKESMICLMSKPSQSFFVYRIQRKDRFFFYRKRENDD